ncbi:PH domain-containing protein [Halopenitus sp. H-Gu1]|uniref:PH domain-containing protein n=1 Tax=Halopenitus sp. H-Gu1 TaxID=3242697 RepID=UPI00359E0637
MTKRTLHPRIRVVWAFRAVLLATILASIAFGATVVFDVPEWFPLAVGGVVLFLTVTHALLRYRRWSYEIREDALYLERGVFTQVRTVVPLVRIQHVDSRRGPTERLVGLASCVVYTAGSRGADVRIPGLTPGDADDLRERLKTLAIRAEGEDAV